VSAGVNAEGATGLVTCLSTFEPSASRLAVMAAQLSRELGE